DLHMLLSLQRPPLPTLFPYTTLFRSHDLTPSEDGGPDEGLQLEDGKWTVQALYRWESQVYLGYALKWRDVPKPSIAAVQGRCIRSEEHTSELQSRENLVCRLLLEKKK